MAKKQKRKQPQPSDFGTNERATHDDIQLEETMVAGQVRARVTTQTQIDRYLKRNEISNRQFDAAERFSAAWFIGCRGTAVTANYDVRIPAASTSVDDHVSRARWSVEMALTALGPQLNPIIVHTVGLDLPASAWAIKHNHSKRSGLTVLKLALDALADHYGV